MGRYEDWVGSEVRVNQEGTIQGEQIYVKYVVQALVVTRFVV